MNVPYEMGYFLRYFIQLDKEVPGNVRPGGGKQAGTEFHSYFLKRT